VHIADVVSLYLLALDKAEAGSLFYAENGEASFKAVTQSIGRMLGLGEKTQTGRSAKRSKRSGPARI
jgi:hypothetical protein